MEVYRITLKKFSQTLQASGSAARWNSRGVEMIYTSSARALACLENVVHRSSLGLQKDFRNLIIEIPDTLKIKSVKKLKRGWHRFENYPYTQAIGDSWIESVESAILRVPSVIIPEEFNFLLNPNHGDFKNIKLLRMEPFTFDGRIKNDL